MKEAGKAVARRLRDPNFATRYFVGAGIDIGGAPDPLADYAELFPLIECCRIWDLEDGDAELMPGLAAEGFDFVHSSHCLEHLVDPLAGLARWFELIRPGGHLIVTVPDEDLYEQGVWPSTFNSDHRWTFTIWKPLGASWSPRSIALCEALASLGMACEIKKIELLDHSHRYGLARFDQTMTPTGESAIEFVVRKRLPDEAARGGRLPPASAPPVTLADAERLTGLRLA